MDKVDPANGPGFTVAWGHSVLEPLRGHVREMEHGQPVTHQVGDAVVGMALCGALLIDDLTSEAMVDEFEKCSACLNLLAEIRRGQTSPP
jgi:hypothetical protein